MTQNENITLFPLQRGSLHDELTKRSSTQHHFTEDFALKLFVEVCEGVAAMHESKPNPLAHRDIKPHNVLLTKDMRPVIMDLGELFGKRKKNSVICD